MSRRVETSAASVTNSGDSMDATRAPESSPLCWGVKGGVRRVSEQSEEKGRATGGFLRGRGAGEEELRRLDG